MKKFILMLLSSGLFLSNVSSLIVEVPNLDKFEKAVENIDQQTLVMFDVDDTLIIPKDLILQYSARYKMSEYAKEALEKAKVDSCKMYGNEDLHSEIFAKTEFEIVNPKVIGIINSLKKRNIKTIAFTKMHTGRYGVIPSLEDWRIEQLKKLKLDFSGSFSQFKELKLLENIAAKPLFKQGVLCADNLDKGPALSLFLKRVGLKPSKVIFIDDNLKFLQSVEEALKSLRIEFIGFHYTEVANRAVVINEDVAKFQLTHLFKTGEWLRDSEVLECVK